MLLRLIRFFRGWVSFRIIGKFPERFINLALKNGIGIFDAKPVDGGLCASVVISDYRLIRPIARRSGVRLRISKKHGLPFVLYSFRHRWGIAVGVALFIIISLIMQNFVWSVELNGVETLSEAQLTAALAESGFSVGKFKGNLEIHKIERDIEQKFDKIGWMSINLIGTHAEVEIKEKASVPEAEYSTQPSNIKASTDGVILSTNIRRGTAEVSVGSAVSSGQLLVSGMYENALGELHFVDADAEVVARTQHSFTATCDEAVSFYCPADTSERSMVSMFWFTLPVTFSPEEAPFTSYTGCSQVFLYDNPIPVTLSTQRCVSYTLSKRTLTDNAAQARLFADCALYKLFNLKDTLSISQTVQMNKTNTGYKLSAEFICTEDIAVNEKLIVNSE